MLKTGYQWNVVQMSVTYFSGDNSHIVKIPLYYFLEKMELNDLRIIIYLRKSEVSVERISVCNVIENLMAHGIYYLLCSYTKDVI